MNFKNFYLNLSNKNKNLIPQVLTVLLLVLVVIYFAINAQNNMGNRGISFGFGFLSQESSFDITFSLIDYDGSHSYARAFLVGFVKYYFSFFYRNIFCNNLRCDSRYCKIITKLFNF